MESLTDNDEPVFNKADTSVRAILIIYLSVVTWSFIATYDFHLFHYV